MQKLQKSILTAVVVSETTHIFCCVLPILFSVLSLMVGTGAIAVMPVFVEDMHTAIHDYEIPMIITSGIILFLGWILYAISKKLDCKEDGCMRDHGPCEPRKDKARIILVIASVLFMVNVTVYFVFHAPMETQGAHKHHHGHSHHHGHDHNHHGHDH
ncbi:MAG: hypothetical protein AAF569_08325 [Pseudomonadota bacterium]